MIANTGIQSSIPLSTLPDMVRDQLESGNFFQKYDVFNIPQTTLPARVFPYATLLTFQIGVRHKKDEETKI